MTLSIGVAYTPGQWKVCVVDQGQPTELHTCTTPSTLLDLVTQICARDPEPTLVLSLPANSPFCALRNITVEQQERLTGALPVEVGEVLQSLRALSAQSYCAPAVAYLPVVSLARRLIRPDLGSANEVCAVIALLHHMRSQEAPWTEMNFLCVRASRDGSSILVVQGGQIINGIGTLQGSSQEAAHRYLTALEPDLNVDLEALQQTIDEAFWEGLTQDLAGLLALHQLEDLVVFGPSSNSMVEHLTETAYQVYLFPYAQSEREGYEAPLGAALLGEGLHSENSATELVEQLQIRLAGRIVLPTDL
jgi:hypothetical protein